MQHKLANNYLPNEINNEFPYSIFFSFKLFKLQNSTVNNMIDTHVPNICNRLNFVYFMYFNSETIFQENTQGLLKD